MQWRYVCFNFHVILLTQSLIINRLFDDTFSRKFRYCFHRSWYHLCALFKSGIASLHTKFDLEVVVVAWWCLNVRNSNHIVNQFYYSCDKKMYLWYLSYVQLINHLYTYPCQNCRKALANLISRALVIVKFEKPISNIWSILF